MLTKGNELADVVACCGSMAHAVDVDVDGDLRLGLHMAAGGEKEGVREFNDAKILVDASVLQVKCTAGRLRAVVRGSSYARGLPAPAKPVRRGTHREEQSSQGYLRAQACLEWIRLAVLQMLEVSRKTQRRWHMQASGS